VQAIRRSIVQRIATLFAATLIVVIVGASIITSAAPSAADVQPALPLRAAFYYPWFPEAWKQQGIYPYTKYHPSNGFYDLTDQAVIRQQIAAMQYGGIQAGIASWWGQGTQTDVRIPSLLSAASGTPFRWTVYYEQESMGDPTSAQINADLTYFRDHYGADPSFLRIDGRFVVFVYADGADGCGMVDRWSQANTVNAYVVLKVFGGYKTCARQPDGWHQYSPAVAADGQGQYSYSISPSFDKVGEATRLGRDLARWKENVRAMVASNAAFQLVTTFNEWGEGTSVESAAEWASPSGYGAYLDVLHTNGADAAPAPTAIAPSATATAPTPTATPAPGAPAAPAAQLTFSAVADARVEQVSPTTNFGTSSRLRADAGTGIGIDSYLRFTVNNVSTPVQKAKIRVYDTTNGSTNGPAIYTTGANWEETTITWNNRPARTSGAIANIGAVGTSSWVEYDVTSVVKGNGTYQFVLGADSSDGVTLASREGASAPQLVLTLASISGVASTATPPTATPIVPTATAAVPTPTSATSDAVLLAAGDIASCASTGDEATAKLLGTPANAIVTLGDNVYDSGTAAEFANCFNPSWGQYKPQIRPAVGNHEYITAGASGYFGYFGAVAGDAKKGYYSYDLGAWHIVALNSNCSQVGGCGAGTPQEQWLRADLAAHPNACTLAYWHHPRFSSGEHGSTTAMQPLWQALYDANADVVLPATTMITSASPSRIPPAGPT
jgi:acid phosphatase type 7